MKYRFLVLIFSFITCFVFSNALSVHHKINWEKYDGTVVPGIGSVKIYFEGANYDFTSGNDPWFSQKIPLASNPASAEAALLNTVFEELTDAEILLLDNPAGIPAIITASAKISKSRGDSYAIVKFLPFRLNLITGKYEKLVSFDLVVRGAGEYKSDDSSRDYALNSVLSSGNWYKIKVQQTGVYKVTYEEMAAMGMSVSGLNSANIRLYGNGGGMLPEENSVDRPDDLMENAIAVFDGGDNVFNSGDYFLFYGQSPDEWKFDPALQKFDHYKNIYSNYTYYFITTDLGQGKRLDVLTSSSEVSNFTSATFNDYAVHETDSYNIIKSGREWLGEIFDLQTTYNFDFSFPDINTSAEQILEIRAVAKSTLSSSFVANINGTDVMTVIVSGTIDNPEGEYAKGTTKEAKIAIGSADINLSLKYNKSVSSSIGWLDYIELNVVRNLKFSNGQMCFRDINSIGEGNITQFNLGNAGSGVTVWEVTDPTNAKLVQVSAAGNNLNFRLATDALGEFVAFDGSRFLSAEFEHQVVNQNLHGQKDIEYVIVAHPDFIDEANRLADFHRTFSGLSVLVTTPEAVYNEFSSGAQDITAIKDLMRMYYERGQQGAVLPRYLLLFGDASYDFKNRMPDNNNFVPTFESPNSLHYIYSYATDDYFGFLDPGEGGDNSDLLDIGIGRFVVDTPEEAASAVDKVIRYASSEKCMDDWRNVITFVADDENGNVHLNQAEQLALFIDTAQPIYNVDKIYIDSYVQQTTPGGQRYPDVNAAINSRIEKGTLIMNYTGHGGEVGWAHERILEVTDINNWTNSNNLAVFVTATCEFARYDDPGRVSAGEYVFLNPKGGGISLFTTARATFGGSNLSLNKGFYKYAFEKVNGEHYAMGDLIRLAKLESTSATNDKKFVLLGDPALKIAYPKYEIHTTSINQTDDGSASDTLVALSAITIKGNITDESGNQINSFNGFVHSIVYDKESEVTTLGQDESSYPSTFMFRKNVIYKGMGEVIDGSFEFSFIVPKDIGYNYGNGKISYYAENGLEDANGYDTDIIIGGFNDGSLTDNKGPEIRLFMNDTTFRNGDITHENPVLYALVFDESGINTVGNSIGHDIMAILNNDSENPYNLNDFYESDLKGFQSGRVSYPFSNLAPGDYEVRFRVWDVYNNSSEAYLKFVVISKDQLVINNAFNRPNPFADETWFEYNHNQANETVDVKIEIFDLSGRLVTTLQQNNTSSGFYPSPIRWDGTAANGNSVDGGIYIYRVNLQSENGQKTSAVKKLVIAR